MQALTDRNLSVHVSAAVRCAHRLSRRGTDLGGSETDGLDASEPPSDSTAMTVPRAADSKLSAISAASPPSV